MIVICNTSPITNLAAIGQFSLLRLLYPQISKAQSHIAAVQPLLDRLRLEAGFFVSESLYQLALELAGEVNKQ